MARRVLFIVPTLLVGGLVGGLVGELALRALPIPGLTYFIGKYDDTVGIVFYPHSTMTYLGTGGERVERDVNSWGFPDVEHQREKPAGSYRIGFFGDSYTEARQVPIDSTFFRLAESELRPDGVECLAFGITSTGTLHSYLFSDRFTPLFDLDLVVYVFVENDPGDNIREIKLDPGLPYASLAGGELVIDNSFRAAMVHKATWYYAAADYLVAHSLLVSTVAVRLKLLLRHGIKLNATAADMDMATTMPAGAAAPQQTDLPSTWPAAMRENAQAVAAAILLKWRREVELQGRDFAVMYVPRGSEWRKPTARQDSWKGWLEGVCRAEGIVLIDPTDEFSAVAAEGGRIYGDHFTTAGHRAFARAFTAWYRAGREE